MYICTFKYTPEQVDHCSLSTVGCPHKSNLFPGRHLQGKVAKHRVPWSVGKVHMGKLHRSTVGFQRLPGHILLLFVQDGKQTL